MSTNDGHPKDAPTRDGASGDKSRVLSADSAGPGRITQDPLPSASGLLGALRDVGSEPADDAVVDALFFHRTLARWLGLPEGRVDGVTAPVSWEYRFWKADLILERRDDNGREHWAAELAVAIDGPVERVSWWIIKDRRGRIQEATWSSAPPKVEDLIPPSAPLADDVEIPDATIAQLFDRDDLLDDEPAPSPVSE